MTSNELRSTCLAMLGAVEEFPWGEEVSVFKVGGKVFAIARLVEDPIRLSLKCDPENAVRLRANHPAIRPGYRLNKRHWNTLTLDGSLPDDLIGELVEDSYDLVVAGLTRTQRAALGAGEARDR